MQTFSQIVSAGTPWRLNVGGGYFRIMNSVTVVDVRFMKAGRIVADSIGVDAGFYDQPNGGFDAVEIYSADPQLLKVAISEGTGGYDRYNGTVSLNLGNSVVNTGVLAVATVSTMVVAANANRKGLRILNSGATAIYLGGAGVDTVNGCLKLNAGDFWLEGDAPAAAWYAVSDGGAGTVKVQELL